MPDSAQMDYYLESIVDVFEQCGAADSIAAVVVEPVQGEGGFIPAPIEWIKAVRQLCDKHGILLIADEVQSGFCRTGRMFASQYWKEAGVEPDILTTAKSIAAGIPLSAIIARDEIMEAPAPGTIGGTYCGNPLACAAALKVLEIMERDHLAERSCEIGKMVMARYEQWKERFTCVGDVRGLGGMVGIEFVKDKATRTGRRTEFRNYPGMREAGSFDRGRGYIQQCHSVPGTPGYYRRAIGERIGYLRVRH